MNQGLPNLPVKTRSFVTGALVPPLGCFKAPWGRGKGAATNLRFKNTGKTSTKWISISDLQCVPALDVKMLPRRVPRPPSLTYVLLTYVLAMPEWSAPDANALFPLCRRPISTKRISQLRNLNSWADFGVHWFILSSSEKHQSTSKTQPQNVAEELISLLSRPVVLTTSMYLMIVRL